MLQGCGGVAPGGRVVILHEPPGFGYYDPGLAPAVARTARKLGYAATLHDAGFSPDPPDLPPDLAAQMAAADATLFLARLGDQVRFRPGEGVDRAIVSYALDLDTLAAPFGTLDHGAMAVLRGAIDRALAAAATIRITCPAGTDLSGRLGDDAKAPTDTVTRRFPLLVSTPMPMAGFAGRVVQRGFLVGTGSRYYTPYACVLEDPLTVHIRGNRIAGFEGAARDIDAAERHYETVAARYGIDPWYVHSWHAGIHPACRFEGPASAGFERWSGSAFGNPRLLHIHTCGAYAPGEISLNIADPTVTADGVAIWDRGRLRPERVPGGGDVLGKHPDLAAAFADPVRECGLGPDGTLGFA